MSTYTLKEQRETKGWDKFVPEILEDGKLYDQALDEFLLDLPVRGIRSIRSLRAIGYDVLVWVRFLAARKPPKSIWEATYADVTAFHKVRRYSEAGHRVKAGTWNRSVASLERLYKWGKMNGCLSELPFRYRTIWHRDTDTGRSVALAQNDAYENETDARVVQFVPADEFVVFRDVGLRGVNADGTPREGARDRNGGRNAIFADMLFATGLRLSEGTHLFAFEIRQLVERAAGRKQVRTTLPDGLTKRNKPRPAIFTRRILKSLTAYIDVERERAIEQWRAKRGWERIDDPIYVYRPSLPQKLKRLDGKFFDCKELKTEERIRVVICADDGTPIEPAQLWLTEQGIPLRANSFEQAFGRASMRCFQCEKPIRVYPHQLRHSFAMHMLSLLVRRHLNAIREQGLEADVYRQLMSDPLREVQALLGHSSITSTYIYLDQLVSGSDTIEHAVEDLMELLPSWSHA